MKARKASHVTQKKTISLSQDIPFLLHILHPPTNNTHPGKANKFVSLDEKTKNLKKFPRMQPRTSNKITYESLFTQKKHNNQL